MAKKKDVVASEFLSVHFTAREIYKGRDEIGDGTESTPVQLKQTELSDNE